MNIVKDIKKDKLSYLFILPIILVSDDTLLFGTSGIPIMEKIKYVILFIWGIWSFSLNKFKFDSSLILPFFFGFLFYVSSFINGGRISGGPLFLMLNLFIALNTTKRFTIFSFGKIFSNSILIISIYSLIIWIGVISKILPTSTFENSAHAIIQTFGGCCFFNLSGSFLLRNSCFFREPGVFMIFLCLSFIVEVFILENKLNKKKTIIYMISILSTFSTAGFLIFGLLYVIYIFNTGTSGLKDGKTNLVFPIIIGAALVGLIISTNIADGVFGKLEKGENSASFLGRISSITIPYQMIQEHPFLGTGIDGFKPLYESIAVKQYGIVIDPSGMSTNTILNAAATFGLWFGVFILWGILKFSKKLYTNRINQIVIFICLILALSNETLIYSAFLYWFVFYGYKKKVLR